MEKKTLHCSFEKWTLKDQNIMYKDIPICILKRVQYKSIIVIRVSICHYDG